MPIKPTLRADARSLDSITALHRAVRNEWRGQTSFEEYANHVEEAC